MTNQYFRKACTFFFNQIYNGSSKIAEYQVDDCEELRSLINTHKYPLIATLSADYLRILQKEVTVWAVYLYGNNDNREFLEKIAMKNKNVRFSVSKEGENKNIEQYFQIRNEDLPAFILYDNQGHVQFVVKQAKNFEINESLEKLAVGKLRMTSGNYIKDLLSSLKIDTNDFNTMIILVAVVFFVLLMFVIFIKVQYRGTKKEEPKKKTE